MGHYPKKVLNQRHAQSNASGAVVNHTYEVICASLGSPVVDDPNLIVTITTMANGAYTIAAQPDVPRNITASMVTDTGADTPGTLVIVGTDRADQVITETIAPLQANVIATTMAFKTVTSITSVGWVQAGGVSDTLVVGTGSLIGLSDKMNEARPLQGWHNNTLEATIPVMTVSATVLALNTVDFTTAWNGAASSLIYLK